MPSPGTTPCRVETLPGHDRHTFRPHAPASGTLVPMTLRRANIARIDGGLFDVLVVGGGINGAVAAAALAGRGASVALVDRGDFGGFTSQESSQPGVGRLQVPRELRAPAGVQAVPVAATG